MKADLRSLFDQADRVQPPDLWEEVLHRTPGPPPREPIGGRIVVIAVALAVAATGFGFGASIYLRTIRLTFQVTNWTLETPTPAPAAGAPPEGKLLLQVPGSVRRVEVLDETGSRQVLGENLYALDLSPDGSKALVSMTARSDATADLQTVDPATGERRTITETSAVAYPARWSPDGSMIAYRADDVLCLVDSAGGSPTCMPGLGRVYWFDWSPDGRSLVLGLPPPEPLTLLDVASGQARPLVGTDDEQVLSALEQVGFGHVTRLQFESPRWSSSGRYVGTLAMVFDTVGGIEGSISSCSTPKETSSREGGR